MSVAELCQWVYKKGPCRTPVYSSACQWKKSLHMLSPLQKYKIHKHISNAHTNRKKIHKYMHVKVFAIFIKYILRACCIHI